MNSFFNKPPWQLAIISGLITGIANQPWHLGILAFIGFVPLLHVLFVQDADDNFRLGYIFGITHNFISFYWIGFNSGASFWVVFLSLIAAVLYLGIFWAIAGWVFGQVKTQTNRLILFPFLIVSMEWIRSFGPMGFPWGNLVLSQLDFLPLIQIIEITGTYGITLYILLYNVILYILLREFNLNKYLAIFAFIFMFGLWITGHYRMKQFNNSSQNINIAILQPNIDPNAKWEYDKKKETIAYMDSLHSIAIELDPDLILFPETALPAYLRLNHRVRNMIQKKVDTSGIPVLTGTVDLKISPDREKKYFNSAMFLKPYHDYIIYDKLHLVPFAEYIPMSEVFPLLKKLNFGQGNFNRGTEYTMFEWQNVRFSNLICYESSIPNIVRKFVENGADMITIQTNDGWLGKSAGPYQHYDIARLRAIENRIPIVRCANTGISGLILANGRSVHEQSLEKSSVFMVSVPLNSSGSFYSEYGDVFALICFVIFLYIGPFKCLKRQY